MRGETPDAASSVTLTAGRGLALQSLVDPGDAVLTWLAIRADRELARGHVDEALPFVERLAELGTLPLRYEAELLQGSIQQDRNEFPRAGAHYRAAAELDPSRPEAHFLLGVSHQQQENSQAAVVALQRARELSPEDSAVWLPLGLALSALGQDLEAEALFQKALIATPRDIGVLEAAATHGLKMGRFGDCAEILRVAGEVAPDNRLVRRLTKEASYLVELAGASGLPAAPVDESRRTMRVVLDGAKGEVERLFEAELRRAGFEEEQVTNARQVWRDYLAGPHPRVQRPPLLAAAVHYTVARLDFVDGHSRDQVAARYGVKDAALGKAYRTVVATLDLAVFDARYSSQPHPVQQVSLGAEADELDTEEVFRVMLEGEYRDYEEAHAGSDSLEPCLGVDDFEDASIEYGSLLTREMMGLTLVKRDRIRKRELERLLLVT